MGASWEPMLGYCMTREGSYPKPIKLESEEALWSFLLNNITKHYEIRITDFNDMCTMHIVDQVLIFPLPRESDKNNKWDSRQQRFITKE